ncbi:MAG: hypothetical protein A3C58_02025 [Candidatus Staskawiczbacteria bacterium RIFCSPHIGHO2_02_FULL_34_10]|uniref:Uncharacterized protein n=1 Tax=Candidatus Staskawiczbacteria bacterium RIFCSPHIGHO2_02_FULL_34_10 TaxID=1802205 RepID=A0A1G2HYL9_9BACT|nr:MAG: hypothetical protein A3C58_02025 [Candidatus Staskawiczbacteria bacterium RIFCSPHIGHO2_02_FULL_34_10]
MFKKYNHLILFVSLFVLVFFALTNIQSVLALELNYPTLPAPFNIGWNDCSSSVPSPTGNCPTLTQYIAYIFYFAVVVAGIIGVLSIIISGFQILLYAGNPSAISAAKERIFGSVLGIILLMFSLVLLQTINPALVNVTQSELLLQPGLYYRGDNPNPGPTTPYVYKPASTQSSNVLTDLPAGFSHLYYKCNPPGKALLVWTYSRITWNLDYVANGNSNATTFRIPCGSSMSISLDSVMSFYTASEEPGVYFFLKTGCEGSSTTVLQESGHIPDFSYIYTELEPPVLSLRIVNEGLIQKYAVILNKDYEFKKECSAPLGIFSGTIVTPPLEEGNCINVLPPDKDGNIFNPFSAYIIKQHVQEYPSIYTATFYSGNLEAKFEKPNIKQWYSYEGNMNLIFTNRWQDSSRVPLDAWYADQSKCKNIVGDYTCLNYIENDGFFNIILYSSNENAPNPSRTRSCEVFFSENLIADDLDLHSDYNNASYINLLQGGRSLYRMDIIPYPK